jgi:DNA-binding response OmpR family regulator
LDGGQGFNILLTDFAMPGMSGAALIREVRKRDIVLPILMMTGYEDRPSDVADIPLIKKPFQPDELAKQIDLVIRDAEQNDQANHLPARNGASAMHDALVRSAIS